MHPFTTISILSSLGSLALPVFALPAADPASPSFIVDPAAVTAAPAVPFTGAVVDSAGASADNLKAATGRATVLNKCTFPVFLYACSQNPAACTKESKLAANGGTYGETYLGASTAGRSIKLGTTSGEVNKPILQFEYTNAGSLVYYDLSEVNGNPFGKHGFTLTSSNSACDHNKCPAPSTHAVCPWVFTAPTNGRVSNCPIGSSIGVTLCG